jgi:hypothetical protein
VGLSFVVIAACSGDETHACTDVGCADGASFTLRPPLSHWYDGAYSLEVTFDSTVHDCSFSVPDDLPEGGSWQPLTCTPALSVFLTPEVDCQEQHDGNNASQVCTPVPEKYFVQGSTGGTPATLHVRMLRDEAVVADETEPLSYSATQPNGPECGPTCHQASVDLTFQ